MKVAELQQRLRAADPAAVLVPPKVVERVMQEITALPSFVWTVPHSQGCVAPRQVLFRHVEQDELDVPADELLPDTVLLLARPGWEELANAKPESLLIKFWRRVFHLRVHTELEQAALTVDEIRERIARIGAIEFGEISRVLVQDQWLPHNASDRMVYVEFVAVYLEWRTFAPELLPAYFPGLRNRAEIDRLLDHDVDAGKILQATRPTGAPDPAQPVEREIDETHEYYWKLMRQAERGERTGNIVRAAIIRRRAARVASAELTLPTQERAVADLAGLLPRLRVPLELEEAEIELWKKQFPILLEKADQGQHPPEASLLFDLQKICLDHENEIYALDFLDWFWSGGQRPIKRPLPNQRLVRIIGHLRHASQLLTSARLSDEDRAALARLLRTALDRCEEKLRARFRPVLETGFLDVGLEPHNPLERTAFQKMVEELLALISENGFFSFSELRDVVSRNQLKLPELEHPEDFIGGDPLLRLDRRLAHALEGVYRPSEIYMRWLERFTALNFGTSLGRWVTLFVTIPFGAAFLFVLALKKFLLEPLQVPSFSLWADAGLVIGLGGFVMALVHLPVFRRQCLEALKQAGSMLYAVFIGLPLDVARHPLVRRAVVSWPFQFFFWYFVKPLAIASALWWLWPNLFTTWTWIVGVCTGLVIGLNSSPGKAAQRLIMQSLASFFVLVRAGLIPGLVRLVILVFQNILHLLEYVLFTVDEWLRFRRGDRWWTMVLRAVGTLLWFPFSYVARFYIVVLIEPCLHPLKFPVASLATKLMVPLFPTLKANLIDPMPFPLDFVGWVTVFFLPDAFGFLFWEMKENWKLYRANRPSRLKAVMIGAHGETMRNLLHPGFHSGTIPKAFARLREASRLAHETGQFRARRAAQEKLREVEHSLRLFLENELIGLLSQARSWQGQRLHVAQIDLATNRIQIDLGHSRFPEHTLGLEIVDRDGWLVAAITHRGWLELLSAEQTQALNTTLACWYHWAGIDLVQEQFLAQLSGHIRLLDIADDRLLVWKDRESGPAVYLLETAVSAPQPESATAQPLAENLQFGRIPLTWNECMQSWQQDQEGRGHPPLEVNGKIIWLLGAAPAADRPVPAWTRGQFPIPERDGKTAVLDLNGEGT